MTPDEPIVQLYNTIIDIWTTESGHASMDVNDLARQILKHPKLFLQCIIEGSHLSGQEVMGLLTEMELATDLALREGDEMQEDRHVWAPLARHVHDYRYIRVVHGEELAFIQCSECNDAQQIDAPSDLFQLPVYHAPG